MSTTTLRLALTGSLALTPLVLSTTIAHAADTTVGQVAPTNGAICNRGPLTVLQTASAAPTFTVPRDGVITSVQMSGDAAAPSPRAFRLARGAGTVWTIVGKADTVSIPAGQSSTQSVRIPARAGDVLGQYVADSETSCIVAGGSSDELSAFYTDAPEGVPTSVNSSGPGYRISVAATLEPDADGDGFGDTTQDRCPTSAATQGNCSFAPGAPGAPGGKAKVGKTISAPGLAGLPAGTTQTYQWYRVRKTHGHHRTLVRPIGGAVAARYQLKAKDRGAKVFVRIALSAPSYTSATVDSLAKRVR